MNLPLQRSAFLESFQCLGDACEDTCCKGWGMQVDAAAVAKYRSDAPELLVAVTTGEAEHIMRRDPETDYCIKFDAGWCGVHKKYGSDFLGDACHFFPRVTRSLGESSYQTASPSCPEVLRLMLRTPDAFALNATDTDRLPASLKHYAPEGMSGEAALALHQLFLAQAGEASAPSAEKALGRIHSVAGSLQLLPASEWPQAAPVFFGMAEGRIPAAEGQPNDVFNLLFALAGLIAASPPSKRPRLAQVLSDIQSALTFRLPTSPSDSAAITPEHLAQYQAMQQGWKQHSASIQPMLHRWLQGQLAVACFPFFGFGDTLPHRVEIMGVRMATLKLALMTEITLHGCVTEESFVRIAQSLARFMDHLADPEFSLKIYSETGWLQPTRLRGLLGF